MGSISASGGELSSTKLILDEKKMDKKSMVKAIAERHSIRTKSKNMMRLDSWEYAVSNNIIFNIIIYMCVAVGCIYVGVSLDHDPDLEVPQDQGNRSHANMSAIHLVDAIFCGIFVVEQLIRIGSYKKPIFYVGDPMNGKWNALDLIVVTIYIIDAWILETVMTTETEYMRALRITRLLRVLRAVRIIPELRILLKSIFSAGRAVFMALVPMVSIIYVFGVIMTEWCNAPTANRKAQFSQYFGTVGESMLTLWQISVYDDCFAIIRQVEHNSAFFGVLLIVFMFIASFMILNVLVGVIREVVHATTLSFKEKFLQTELEDIYDFLDDHEDSRISQKAQSDKGVKRLKAVGVKEETLPTLIRQMDPYDSGTIPRDVFVLFFLRSLRAPQSQELIIALKTVSAIRGLLHEKRQLVCQDIRNNKSKSSIIVEPIYEEHPVSGEVYGGPTGGPTVDITDNTNNDESTPRDNAS